MKDAKRPSRTGADGEQLESPVFKYSLQIGKKGDSIKVKLKKEHYGKKWIIAKKK